MTHSPSPGPPGVSRCALREMKNQFKDEILLDDNHNDFTDNSLNNFDMMTINNE